VQCTDLPEIVHPPELVSGIDVEHAGVLQSNWQPA
jgi:hypothetical protein